ncbi:hypothetical protein SAMN04488028_101398 [Reichenbachiella agariperforans]|uniref:Outer membrane protein beta-barrel domain-containing protein n=1 Tax=Reichenbachiella agariperforans TaxID=156994 RepID=A0A1M6K0G4_REIAG|nr:hypothetical protein [Reichenbachiella agariperforans]SHJ52437.1 hypothetical protein SAMN04488028_101398 [Reichenbachiella agariperforans]
MFLRIVLIGSLVTMLSISQTKAQVFFGAGYTHVKFSDRETDASGGLTIATHYHHQVEDSKLGWQVALNVGMMYEQFQDEAFPYQSYFSDLDIIPSLTYRLIHRDKINLYASAGPFLSWTVGIRDGNLDHPLSHIDEWRAGIDVGLGFDYALFEKLQLKIMPFTFQYGNNNYQQYSSVLYIRL